MGRKRRKQAEPGTDEYLCPAKVGAVLGAKRRVIAQAMREAGRVRPLTVAEANLWHDRPGDAPEEGVAILAAVAADKARREHRKQSSKFEDEHRMMLLTEKVEKRLLAGVKHFSNADAELIATDIAFRASKELLRTDGPACGDVDPHPLPDLDVAALRWAGIDPSDHSTWAIHRGDCPGQ